MEKIEKGQHHCPPRCDPLRGQSAFGLSLMKGDQRPKQLRAKKKPKKKKKPMEALLYVVPVYYIVGTVQT